MMKFNIRIVLRILLCVLVIAWAGFSNDRVSIKISRQAAGNSLAAKVRNQSALADDFAIPVLMYHRICTLTPHEEKSPLMRDLTVSPADFELQIRYLTENGFTILSAQELVAALLEHRPLPQRAVALTMDDGYRDNFTEAFPILRKYGVSATVFLVTSAAGRSDHISWDNARTMTGAGWGIESHTVNHYDLPTLDDKMLTDELVISKQVIEVQTGKTVTQLAYPSGAFDSRVTEFIRQAGYSAGWKKGGGPVTPGCDPYRLPRVRVNGRITIEDFKRTVWSGVWTRRIANAKRHTEV